MIGLLSPVLGILKAVPWWAYAGAALLGWGAYNRHDAKSQERQKNAVIQQVAAEEAKALRATIAESERRVAAHQEIASAAQSRIAELERSVAAVRSISARVRPAVAAFAASAAASNPATAGDCTAATKVTDLLTNLLGRTVDRATELAHLADRSRAAGEACEAIYDALTKGNANP